MPSAGDFVRALDFPQSVFDNEGADETGFTSTLYTQGAAVCGVAFVAPTSGRVLVLFNARFESNTADVFVYVSAAVRTGATIGSGTDVVTANDGFALSPPNDASGGARQRQSAGNFRFVSGLTAGSSYNAVTEHKMSAAGNGDIFDRSIAVIPLP